MQNYSTKPTSLIIFLLFIYNFGLAGNYDSSTDSLLTLLKNTKKEQEKANLYNELANEIKHFSYDTALLYLDTSLTLALKYNNKSEEARSYQIKAVIFNSSGKYNEAINLVQKALLLFKQNKDTLGLVSSYSALGVSYSYINDYSEAIDYYTKSYELATALKDTSSIILMLNNIAFIYNTQKRFDKSLSLILRSIEMKSSIQEQDIVVAYVNAGSIYYNINDLSKAKSYLEIALGIANKYNLISVKMTIFLKLGHIYFNTSDYDLAEEYFNKAYQMQEEMEDIRGMSMSLKGIGKIYLRKGLYDKAEEYFLRSLEAIKNNNLHRLVSDIYVSLSELYNSTQEYKKSRDYLNMSYSIKDSITNSSINEKLEQIETRYQKAKSDKEIMKLETEKKQKESKIREQRNWMILLVIIAFLIVVSFLLILIQKRKKDKAYKSLLVKNLEEIDTPVDQTINIDVDSMQSEDIIDDNSDIDQNDKESTTFVKYKNSQLSQSQKEELIVDIIKLMEEEKMFLNPDLTLDDIASRLDIYKNYISQVVNEKFNLNFNNFVNKYRVKETQKLLLDPKNDILSIEGIATTVGFNTKSSFNTAFKKFTGLTPSYFRNHSRNKQ